MANPITSFTFVKGNIFSWELANDFASDNLLAINILLGNTDGFVNSTVVPIYDFAGVITKRFIVSNAQAGAIYNASLLVSTHDGHQYIYDCTQKDIMIEAIAATPIIVSVVYDKTVQLSLNTALTDKSQSAGYCSVEDLILSVFYTDPSGIIHSKLFSSSDISNNIFIIDQLVNGLTYDFAVIITNNVGVSIMSNNIEATPNDTPDVVTVTAINLVSILNTPSYIPTQTGIRIFITPPEEVFESSSTSSITLISIPVDNFTIKRLIINGSSATLDASNVIPISGMSFDASQNKYYFDDTSCTVGTTYKYNVSASNKNSSSTAKGSNADSDQIICLNVAATPAFSVLPDNASAILTVTPPEYLGGSTLKSYWVKVTNVSTGSQIKSVEMSADKNNIITVNNLTNGIEVNITCQVITYNYPSGELYGTISNIVKTTPYGPPSAPTNLVSTNVTSTDLINNGIVLTWNQSGFALNSGGSNFDYIFSYKTSVISDYLSITPDSITTSNIASNSARFTFTDNDNGKSYYFRIQSRVYNTELEIYVYSQISVDSNPSIVYSLPKKITSILISKNESVITTILSNEDNPLNNADVTFNYVLMMASSYEQILTGTLASGESNISLDESLSSSLVDGSNYYLIATPSITVMGNTYYGVPTNSNSFVQYSRPEAPLSITALVGDGIVYVSWSSVPPVSNGVTIEGYKIYVNYTAITTDTETTAHVGPSVHTTPLRLTNDLSYSITVVAYGNTMISSSIIDSNILGAAATIANVRPTSNPTTPTGLVATTSSQTITLNWSNSDSSRVNGYNIIGTDVSGSVVTNINTTLLTHKIQNLTNGAQYSFSVFSYLVTDLGQTIKSLTSAVINTVVSPVPNVVTGLSYTRTSSGANLFWSVPTSNGTGYQLYYKVVVNNNENTAVYNITSANYILYGLTNRSVYSVDVVAYYLAGGITLSQSVPVNISVIPSQEPFSLAGLEAVPGDKQVTLNWTYPVDPSFTMVDVIITRSGVLLKTISSADPSTFIERSLVNGTAYDYTLNYKVRNNTDNGLEFIYSYLSVTPFGKPIISSIVAPIVTENNISGYKGVTVNVDLNGTSVLIGCMIIGIALSGQQQIIVITTPTITYQTGSAVVTGTFENLVSDFAIIPYNIRGSSFDSYPADTSVFC